MSRSRYMTEKFQEGLIVRSIGGLYTVACGDELVDCRARGKFRLDEIKPMVGDRVRIQRPEVGEAVIRELCERKNSLIRPAVANIGTLVVIASEAPPVTQPFLIDRVSAIAGHKGIDMIVCVNKCDQKRGDSLIDIYTKAGFRVIPLSAKTGEGIDELRAAMTEGIFVLTGNSGVGKSSLLAAISAARPKIADYHFTTLSPNLGVVQVEDGQGFVVADIPGLIDGAAEGAGLGHDFLRHIDRCRLLLHVVDISCFEGRDPIQDVKNINAELEKYSPTLATRPQIILANKCDSLDESVVDVKAFEDFVDENGWEMMYVSAVTHEGIKDMIHRVYERLKLLPPITVYESELEPSEALLSDLPGAGVKETVIRRENNTFYVEGDWIYNLMGRINFDDYESLNYFQRVLQSSGVFDMLEEKGCKDGDTVSIYDFAFDYIK